MMRTSILVLLLAILLHACTSSDTELKEAEGLYAKEPTKEHFTQLITLYDARIKELGTEDVKRREYLERSLELSRENKSSIRSMIYLKQLLNDYPEAEERITWLEQLGEMYKVINKPQVADVYFLSFTERYPQNVKTPDFKKMIRSDQTNADSLLNQLSYAMFNDSLLRLEPDLAYAFIDGCEAYSIVNRGEPESAEYLHKSAETLRSLRAIDKSLVVYDKIIEQYPDHPRASQALFLKAFTYDNNLKEFDSARKYYTVFLEKYPNDDFTSSANFLLENLGKSDDELIEILQSKGNKEDVVE